MNAVVEVVAGLIGRARRRPRGRWLLILVLAAAGFGAQAWVSLQGELGFWASGGYIAVAAGVAFARSHVPLLTAIVLVLEALAVDISVAAAVPLALALLAWHVCASLLSTGRPWARLGRTVVAAYRMPLIIAVTVVALTAVAAAVSGGWTLPAAPTVSMTALLAIVVAGIIALWPERHEP